MFGLPQPLCVFAPDVPVLPVFVLRRGRTRGLRRLLHERLLWVWLGRVFQSILFLKGDSVTPRKRYAFWIDLEQEACLNQIRERDGILPSEQIRRAIDDWFTKKRVKVKGRTRAAIRKRRSPST